MTPKSNEDEAVSVAEKMASSTAEIVRELILAHQKREDVNLNKLKTKIGKKYKLKSQPRLVDIIAAVPNQYRSVLVPKLKVLFLDEKIQLVLYRVYLYRTLGIGSKTLRL